MSIVVTPPKISGIELITDPTIVAKMESVNVKCSELTHDNWGSKLSPKCEVEKSENWRE